MTISKEDITGLVLAGGRGSRMGGVDKGLQNHLGMPLALYTLLRLGAQVGHSMINANRNLAAYESMGAPVWPDALPDYPGPLAGFLAGLEHCETPWLVTVPCDTPNFPDDLVARLAAAAEAEGAEVAMAATREPMAACNAAGVQPAAHHAARKPRPCHRGRRTQDRPLTAQHRCAVVAFDDADAFFCNTLAELQSLQNRR
jgi:molybdopterin-guanine dinucleotide biosynthesis protein A